MHIFFIILSSLSLLQLTSIITCENINNSKSISYNLQNNAADSIFVNIEGLDSLISEIKKNNKSNQFKSTDYIAILAIIASIISIIITRLNVISTIKSENEKLRKSILTQLDIQRNQFIFDSNENRINLLTERSSEFIYKSNDYIEKLDSFLEDMKINVTSSSKQEIPIDLLEKKELAKYAYYNLYVSLPKVEALNNTREKINDFFNSLINFDDIYSLADQNPKKKFSKIIESLSEIISLLTQENKENEQKGSTSD